MDALLSDSPTEASCEFVTTFKRSECAEFERLINAENRNGCFNAMNYGIGDMIGGLIKKCDELTSRQVIYTLTTHIIIDKRVCICAIAYVTIHDNYIVIEGLFTKNAPLLGSIPPDFYKYAGTKLMKAIMDEHSEKIVYLTSLSNALGFYKKLGFVEFDGEFNMRHNNLFNIDKSNFKNVLETVDRMNDISLLVTLFKNDEIMTLLGKDEKSMEMVYNVGKMFLTQYGEYEHLKEVVERTEDLLNNIIRKKLAMSIVKEVSK